MRNRWSWIALAGLMLAIAAVFAAPLYAAATPSPGSGGWYWPTGTEDFGGFSAFDQFRGDDWHLAQDMKSVRGRPVYAIGDGVVLEAKNVGGYGPGSGPGGAMVILHKTVTGAEFKALYGHVERMRYRKGDRVKAGAVIASINGYSPEHTHFGIHPGRAYPPDRNPFRGHTYRKGVRYGFVDPVKYLRTHLRAYSAPPVPVVATVSTTSTPLWSRASCGSVYWATRSDDETATWAYQISARARRRLDESATVPAADTRRYSIARLTSPPRLRVSDKRPKVPFTISPQAPAWGSRAAVRGRVTNAANRPFGGAKVTVERRTGSRWVALGRAYTNADGRWSIRYTQAGTYAMRVRFSPRSPYVACSSAVATVTPKAAITRPGVSAGPKPRSYNVAGTMRPKHGSGAVVELTVQRLVDGAWVQQSKRLATVYDRGATNGWRNSMRLPIAGTYRVRAKHPGDSRHVCTYTAWTTIKVK